MKPSLEKITFVLLFLVLSTIILIYAGPILKPFAFALIAVSIYHKPAAKIESFGVSRFWSVFLTMVVGSVIVVLVGYLVSRETVQVMSTLKSELNVEKPSETIAKSINEIAPGNFINLTRDEVSAGIKKWLGDSGLPFLGNTFKSTGFIISNALLSFIYTFFLLLYRRGIAEVISNLGSRTFSKRVNELIPRIINTGKHYITGLGILILILAILYGITFSLFGLDYAIVFAIVAALLAIIPYIGTTLGASLPVIYAYLTYDNHFIALGLIASIMLIQTIEGNFLTPKIVGGNMKLNPFASLVAVIVGNFIWGLAGMILFLPLVAMSKIIWDNTDSLKALAYLSGEEITETDQEDG